MLHPKRGRLARRSRVLLRLRRAPVSFIGVAMLAGCGSGGGSPGSGPIPTTSPPGLATPSPAPSPTPLPSPTPSLPVDSFVVATGSGPGIAWGDGTYLVAFSVAGDRGFPDLVALRLDSSGGRLDETPFLLSDAGDDPFLEPSTAAFGGPAAGFDGARFGVFFSGSGTSGPEGPPASIIAFTAVSQEGTATLPSTTLAEQESFSMVARFLTGPSDAAGAAGELIGMFGLTQLLGSPGQSIHTLLGSWVSGVGSTVDATSAGQLVANLPPPVSDVISTAGSAGVAANPSSTLAAWVESSFTVATGESETYLQGALLERGADPERVRLATISPAVISPVSVATDGRDHLVTWVAPNDSPPAPPTQVFALRVGATGEPDPAGARVVARSAVPMLLGPVAFCGGSYLVVWVESEGQAGVLRGAPVSPEGRVGDAFTIDEGPAAFPSVASSGASCLVLFQKDGDDSEPTVFGRFVVPE